MFLHFRLDDFRGGLPGDAVVLFFAESFLLQFQSRLEGRGDGGANGGGDLLEESRGVGGRIIVGINRGSEVGDA